MQVGFVGVGAMGEAMAENILKRGGHRVMVYDVRAEATSAIAGKGADVAGSLEELARVSEVIVIMVATDRQVRDVVSGMKESLRSGMRIVVASTVNPHTVIGLSEELGDTSSRVGVVDAPVVYGLDGAQNGELVSLCGGEASDVEFVEPVLSGYSRRVYHVGALGSGEIAKTANNMLHWAASLANYEALLLGKAFGIDAAHLREVLLDCPGKNGTLERFESSKFTWSEKDMDIALDLAQERDLMLPFYGLVDQLIRPFSADGVQELLHREPTNYLGRKVDSKPMSE